MHNDPLMDLEPSFIDVYNPSDLPTLTKKGIISLMKPPSWSMTLARLDRRTRGVMRRRCPRSLFFRTSLRAILYTFVRRATVQPSFYTLFLLRFL